MSSDAVRARAPETHEIPQTSSPPLTLVVRLLAEPAARGELVGHVEVVRSGEVVAITCGSQLERLAKRLATGGYP